jgi:DMSO reductase anchor subunit
VTVTTPGGSYTLESALTVKQGVPIIATVSPGQGGQGATLTVIISGSNLGEATSVNFGSGITVQSFNNLSPTQISANVVISENAVMGMRDVSVTTPGGSTTKSNSFSIEKKSLGVLLIVFIWLGVVLVIGLFVLIITLVRRRKPIMKE